jgi:hypothetical protein
MHETTIEVNSGHYSSSVDQSGNFSIEVPVSGTYRLDVLNVRYYFEPVVVEVTEETDPSAKNIKAYLWSLRHGKDTNVRLAYPLHLEPSARNGYFEEEVPFNVTKYAMHPMVMMVGVMVVMKFMTGAIDPEELKKQQKE